MASPNSSLGPDTAEPSTMPEMCFDYVPFPLPSFREIVTKPCMPPVYINVYNSQLVPFSTIVNELTSGFYSYYQLQKQIEGLKNVSYEFVGVPKPEQTPSGFLQEIRKNYWGQWRDIDFKTEINEIATNELPAQLQPYFIAVNSELGPLNFYSSFSTAFVGDITYGISFRDALIYYAFKNPEEFGLCCKMFHENPEDVLSNLKNPTAPTNTELWCLSTITGRNITVFSFDNNWNLSSDVFYNANRDGLENLQPIFLGKIHTSEGVSYFPLIRKDGINTLPCARTSILTTISNNEASGHSSMKPCTLLEPYFEAGVTINEIETVGCFNDASMGLLAESVTDLQIVPKVPTETVGSGKGAIKIDPKIGKVNSEMAELNPLVLQNNGLQNFGNTCYFNAVIQSVLSLPNIFRMHHHGPLQSLHGAIYKNHASTSLQVEASETGYKELITSLEKFELVEDTSSGRGQCKKENKFSTGEQMDSHELIKEIFSTKEYNYIEREFQFITVDVLACPSCGNTRKNQELSSTEIIMQPNTNIQEYVSTTFSSEYSEQVVCKCGSCPSNIMNKTSEILEAPKTLMVLTQIFDAGGQKQGLGCQSHLESLSLPSKSGEEWFELNAVITHAGVTAQSGHYVAYIRKENCWVRCDDQHVDRMDELNIKKYESVYLQFYSPMK